MSQCVIELTKTLIERQSVTPDDGGCQDLFIERLSALDFHNESMVFGDTRNLYARRGQQAPLFVFAGHTDVVPAGPPEKWDTPPFNAVERDGFIHGRGAADMKASLAAMLIATERFVIDYPNHKGSIGFLITSDEEGPATNGTVKVIETLQARDEAIDYCLVGEPSSTAVAGDTVKNGRRGSLSGHARIYGKQGHVAYPHLAENPIHHAAPVIKELSETRWDEGNEYFPPTTFQISNIHGGTGATNVIPGQVQFDFNFRFCTETNEHQLKDRVSAICTKHNCQYDIDWNLSGHPFITEQGGLVAATQAAIKTVAGFDTELSTAGGTSDGRFIAPTGAQVIELGPCNATIHQVNERVAIDDVRAIEAMYYELLCNLLAP